MSCWTCDFCVYFEHAALDEGRCRACPEIDLFVGARDAACARFVNRFDITQPTPLENRPHAQLPQPKTTDPPPAYLVPRGDPSTAPNN